MSAPERTASRELAAGEIRGNERRKALITGITGQDGSYLAELLLGKGYEVHGVIRRSSSFNTGRIDHLYADPHTPGVRLFLHHGDLSDGGALNRLLRTIRPDEIYNLGAQSHVRASFDIPEYTADITAVGTVRLLEAMRETGTRARFYQASSSELYGQVAEIPQRETTAFHPRSPYGCAKAYAFHITRNYREAYGLFACNGILFNHESPRRGETFVTQKIARAVARIRLGLQQELFLGNLEARRDWGYAPEYVEAMWLMLQQDTPSDYVIATGETHSVREFLEVAFGYLDLDWREHVRVDERYYRPAEVDLLIGDASRAKKELGWEPRVTFAQLVRIMVDAAMEEAGDGRALEIVAVAKRAADSADEAGTRGKGESSTKEDGRRDASSNGGVAAVEGETSRTESPEGEPGEAAPEALDGAVLATGRPGE